MYILSIFTKSLKKRFIKKIIGRYYGGVVSLLFLAIVSCCWLTFFDQSKKDYSNIVEFSSSDLLIDFLDVGSADSVLIHDDKHLIIIDAGLINSELSIPDYIESEIFEKRSIKKIDLMVLTHPHADHYGQMVKILDRIETSRFLTSRSSRNKSDRLGYNKIVDTLKEKNITIEYSKPGAELKIGEISLNILGPVKQDKKNINNNSVVLRLEYHGTSFLFTGDAEKEEENDLINTYGNNLKSDILKAGHHGSSTSSSLKFLKAVSPDYVIVSARDKKDIHYPHTKVVNSLNSLGIPYLVTQDCGTIRVSVDKNGKMHIPNYNNKEIKKAA